ncbi:ATP-dependent Clp protease ATP-binding subunit [Heyndrickxia sporothermodurans]|uniref:ATP-dependent Clp protease ATP-binding subunit n=1 Tax=Heyndrickxia sporothermodurans TaxID=46224 RepID=UPI002DB888EA|nr:ATP-dependent Clp protease ATP-binding subunit [Heyndrickxia sporothermodurans]MEB6549880.1 ATP-dependent Clp protease ATP-binding subunit [Heyndrickxia sporothermodurans]
MKCQKCQMNLANVQLRVNINGHTQNLHLCSECYQKEFAMKKTPFGGIPSMNGFEDLFKGLGNFSEVNMNTQEASHTGNNSFLDKFGKNLTNIAKAGLIDPVIGRDQEINRVIEILNRRNKNNPVLIGEPGVGKTAIAEGLALKIAENNVPAKLKNKEVYLLDVASLVANTGIRGQFEERMKQLIGELQSRKNILLFIDEIHLLVGAGSAEGSMDAGNILKPALARGELQVIGATTLKEYRQIEKDAALERRFQPVQVSEPTIEQAINILNGLKEKYENYHQVKYSDEAINACVNLSHRYIQDRYLPDKAIDLMDEAGSKLNLTFGTTDRADIKQRLVEIESEKQKALEKEDYETAAKLRDEEEKLEKTLNANDQTNHSAIVDVSLIQEIIEQKTGIPVGKLQEDEQQKMKNIEKNLAKKVIGQEEAVKKIAKAIRRSRAGLKSKNRPIGSFLFVGPTGVGKTELTKTLAEELFGTKDAMIRLDMSEFMEKHSVSKLIGSPPGYVGHDEAGQLTEKVRRNPYSIILLDEIEKAHPDVQHMFLQILEDGRLTDSQGRTVSFKDTVIIMTSNAGTATKEIHVGFGQNNAVKETSILDSLGSFFKPEFLNRFDNIIEFQSLKKEHLLEIVDLMINELNESLAEQQISLEVTNEVKEKLAELGYHPAFGARPLRRVIQEQLEDRIADYILEHPDQKELVATLKDNTISVSIKN